MNFNERVYALTRRVPRGRVTTYGEIARAMGTTAYRAVGNALNRAEGIPCHRVVRSDGSVGGYAHGTERKTEMLRREGVEIVGGMVAGFKKVVFHFK
jgi:methylated-DNA-[protein]-cysteine S-methyltransferase